MDALALLCTLHADGPTTLRRLRRAGCSTLKELEAFDPEELGRALEVAPAVARRLHREAHILGGRLGPDLLERESEPGLASVPAVRPGAEASTSPVASERDLDRTERAIVGEVLDTWRRRDSREPEPPVTEPPPTRLVPAATAPRPTLTVGAVDGLDPALVSALADRGIGSLADLASADAVTVAASLGIPFARLRRLQFLAARSDVVAAAPLPAVVPQPPAAAAVTPGSAQVIAPEPAPEVAPEKPTTVLDWNFEIPVPPPPAEASHEEPGGPFA